MRISSGSNGLALSALLLGCLDFSSPSKRPGDSSAAGSAARAGKTGAPGGESGTGNRAGQPAKGGESSKSSSSDPGAASASGNPEAGVDARVMLWGAAPAVVGSTTRTTGAIGLIGAVDELRVYDHALALASLTELADAGSN